MGSQLRDYNAWSADTSHSRQQFSRKLTSKQELHFRWRAAK